MKKLFFIIFLFISFQSFGQRFPSIDSLQTYILRYFRNSTVETFTNLRGQNIVYGTTEFLEDIVANSGVDSIWIVDGGSDADTLRYRKWAVTYTAGLISGGGGGSGTVTSFAFTNSTGITGTVTNPTTTPTLSLVIDSGAIANFSAKVRSLVSATYPIQYTSGTGVFNLDTSAGHWRSENYYNTKYALIGSGVQYTLINGAANVGSGAQVFKDTSSNKINLRSIVQGWNIKVTQNTNDITISVDTTTQTLTDGATITFDANAGVSAKVTLGGNRTLAFSNFRNGMFLSLLIIQDGTGGRTITLPASTRVINGGAGAVTLTTAASSHDVLTFWKENDIIYCNYGKNYN